MPDNCIFPLCRFNAVHDEFCIHHAKHFGAKQVKEKKKIPLKSAKRIAEDKLYREIVSELLTIDPNCKVKAIGCQVKASGLHHIQKRTPKNWLDRNNLIQACNSCQTWIELNPLEAIKKGVSKSKHIKA